MPFECEECGLEKQDSEKNVVVDGIKIKYVCNSCLDLNMHVVLKSYDSEEISKKIKKLYEPKTILKKLSGVKVELDDFRKRLRMERIKKGLSIKELAKLLNIKAEELEKFEKGLKEDFYIRKKIIEFFGIRSVEATLESFKNKETKIDFKSDIKLYELLE